MSVWVVLSYSLVSSKIGCEFEIVFVDWRCLSLSPLLRPSNHSRREKCRSRGSQEVSKTLTLGVVLEELDSLFKMVIWRLSFSTVEGYRRVL